MVLKHYRSKSLCLSHIPDKCSDGKSVFDSSDINVHSCFSCFSAAGLNEDELRLTDEA